MNPVKILKQKWSSNDYLIMNYTLEGNYQLKDDQVIDIGVLLNGQCVAFGKYFKELEECNENDSRTLFHKYGANHHLSNIEFAFYFDCNRLIVNDLKQTYPFDELLNDFNVLYERIKKRTIE